MPSFLKSAWNELAWVVRVSRPRFWIYLFGPYLIGMLCALRVNVFGTYPTTRRVYGLWHLATLIHTHYVNLAQVLIQQPWFAFALLGILFLVFAYPLLPANLFIYGVNDLFDQDTDALNPKKNGYELRLPAGRKQRLVVYIILSQLPWLFIVLASLFLDHGAHLPAAGVFFSFLFLGLFYSAPPIRAKARPWFDSLFNILYVMPGLFAYLGLIFISDGHLAFPWLPFLAASCWCMAMHAYSAVPDIEADSKAGLRTIATTLGAYKTLFLCLALYIASSLLAFIASPSTMLSGIMLLLGLVYVILINISFTHLEDLMPIYRRFPLVNTLVGATLFFALLLF